MKKILSVLLAVILITSSISVGCVFTASAETAQSAVNLITNGDFEDQSAPSRFPSPFYANPRWQNVQDYQKWFRADGGNNDVNSKIITDPDNPNNKVASVMQTALHGVTITSGKTYRLRFSIKATTYNFKDLDIAFVDVTNSYDNPSYSCLYPFESVTGTRTYKNGSTTVTEPYSPTMNKVYFPEVVTLKLALTSDWVTYELFFTVNEPYKSSVRNSNRICALKFHTIDFSGTVGNPNCAPFYLDDVSLYETTPITVSAEDVNGKSGGYIENPSLINAVVGEELTLKAVPFEGNQFVGWYLNGNLVSGNAEYTFTVESAADYIAIFTTNTLRTLPSLTNVTADDIIAEDSSLMINYPHYGTPAFVEPGGQFIAEVRAPASLGTSGWKAWVENEYRVWDCAVGTVTYGPNNVYLGLKSGYAIPVTLPADVSPELLTLVVHHSSGLVLRSPMAVSVVPNLNSNFYIMALTDTHLGWNLDNTQQGNQSPTALGLMFQALKVTGVRFVSHTGDTSTYPLRTKGDNLKRMVIEHQLKYSGTTIPLVMTAGNHEYDPYVYPTASLDTYSAYDPDNDGIPEFDGLGRFNGDDFNRYFGMQSALMPMGSMLIAKHDFYAYWGDRQLISAMATKWNAYTGATYRLLFEHTHRDNNRSLFSSPDVSPTPTPYPNLELKGHDHQWTVNQTSPYRVLSLGGGGGGQSWEGGSGALINFNYSNGSWSSSADSGSWTKSQHQYKLINDARYTSPSVKIRDVYAKVNDGTATSNSCTIENDVNFNFFDGRVRFVMRKGNYIVTNGEKLAQYDSTDGSKTIVLTKVNIPASGSVTVSVQRDTALPEYTVTFNSQGGSTVAPLIVEEGSKINAPTAPTRQGYVFDGWYTAATGGTKVTFPYTVTGDVTFYARWVEAAIPQYTVIFNSQGGSIVAPVVVDAGSKINAPAVPTRQGYTFKGWYTSSQGGQKITFPYTVTQDITLYAQWEAEVVAENLLAEGDFESYQVGITLFNSTTNTQNWTGTAISWHNGVITDKYAHSGSKSLRLFSRHNAATRKVTGLKENTNYIFSFYYFIPEAKESEDIYSGAKGTNHFSLAAVTEAGYPYLSNGFIGEVDSVNEGKKVLARTEDYSIYTTVYGEWTKITLNFNTGSNTAVDLHIRYASWNVASDDTMYLFIDDMLLYENPEEVITPQYTVIFNSQGGSTVAPVTVEEGTAIEAPAEPTKAGYVFDGWYTEADGGTKVTFPYTVTGNIVLYAHWVEATSTQYTVTFDSQGGSTVAPVTVAEGTAIDAPTAPTKSGFAFDGWYTEPQGGEKVTFPYTVTRDIALYAQWIEVNLITNGDFETDTGFNYQVPNRFDSPQGKSWTTFEDFHKWLRASLGNETIHSKIITDPENPNNRIASIMQTALQSVAVEDGKTYVLRFSAKGEYAFKQFAISIVDLSTATSTPVYDDRVFPIVSAAGTKSYYDNGTLVTEEFDPYDAEGQRLLLKLDTDKWVTYEIEFTLGEGMDPQLIYAILFRCDDYSGTPGDPSHARVYMDNVSLEEVPEPTYTPGDINNDGKIDLKDVTALSRHIAGWSGIDVVEAALDVNGDKKIDLKDVTQLARYIAGWDVEIY